MNADDFINAARSFIGTPFSHQGRSPGAALDCAGMVICAAKKCGLDLPDKESYATVPDGMEFVQIIESVCNRIPLAVIKPGDLLVFAWTKEPQHIAIVSNVEPMRIVHSWSGAAGVVENDVDDYWKRRLRRCYRLKGMD